MDFATFKGTYAGLPLDVIERTGVELETKYFKNRDASSKLNQAMANAKVEDRNIIHLARATQDVDNIFKEVEGKWHYATNAVYKATDRVTNDKVLNAALEDYQKSAAQQTEIQKRVDEGKIGQDAAIAYAKNNNRYNNKAIELDQETGQLKNRWGTPPPPPKPDMDKKVMEITTLMLQHADSLAYGLASKDGGRYKKGDPIYEIFEQHPGLEGHIMQSNMTGVDGEKIASAVYDWVKTNPEVKAYYDYINDANTFDMITQKGADGKYATDETGNFIQRDLTQSDFAALGIDVDENWDFRTNKIAVPDKNDTLTTNEIKDIGKNLKDTPMFKALLSAGFSEQQALQRVYTSVATDMTTNAHVSFAANFGYTQHHTSTHEDKAHWDRVEQNRKKEDALSIVSGFVAQVPAYKAETFNVKDNLTYIDNLRKELDAIPIGADAGDENNVRRAQLQGEIENRIGADRVLRKSYLQSPEGQTNLDAAYRELYNGLSRENKDKLKNNPEIVKELKNYIAGLTDESPVDLGRTITTNTRVGGPLPLFGPKRSYESDTDTHKLNKARGSFSDNLTKNIQTKGVEISATTTRFIDKQGASSKVNDNVADWIIKSGNSFNISYGMMNSKKANKSDIASTLGDYYNGNNPSGKQIDPTNYESIIEFGDPDTNMAGKIIIRIVPRHGTATDGEGKLEDFDRLIIEPQAEVKGQVMMALADIVENNSANDFGKNWADQQRNSALYDPIFSPLKYEIVTNELYGSPSKLQEARNIYGVPVREGNERGTANFRIVPLEKGYAVYQLKLDGNLGEQVMQADNLTKIQNAFYNKYTGKIK